MEINKILFINSLYHPYKVGGAEISVQILAEELVSQGNEVVVITLAEQTETKVINGVKIYYLEIENLYFPATYNANILQKAVWHGLDSYNPFYKRKITQIIRDERPDLVHTHNISGFSVNIWDVIKDRFDLPIIHTLRDYYLLCPRGRMYENEKRCHSQCRVCSVLSVPKKKKSSKVDYVTGISSYVLNRHIQNGYFPKVLGTKVIPNPVDINSISPTENARYYKEGEIVLGFLGRLEPAKGIESLLERISSTSSIQLLVGGKGEENYITQLKRKFECNNVRFLGFVNPGEFFKKIDYLVVPSLWEEPFGRVVIEAYAAGVPVIGSKRGGITDLVDDQKTGWLFEPDHDTEFERILDRLQNSDTGIYQNTSENCIEKAQLYDSDRIADLYMNLYSKFFAEG